VQPLWRLAAWGALAIALNVGIARFTYGVVLPALQRDLGLDHLAGGTLNAVHLFGYVAGTLASPAAARRFGMARLCIAAHAIVAAGAILCALAPNNPTSGFVVLASGRLATGIGAGAGIVSVLVLVFAMIAQTARPVMSALVWSGMGVAIIASGIATPWLLTSHTGWRAAFFCAAFIALIVILTRPRIEASVASPAAAPARFLARDLLRADWRNLSASYFLFGVAYVAYSTFAGARLVAMQAPLAVTSATWIMFGITAIAGAVLTVPVLQSRAKDWTLVAALTVGALGSLCATADHASMSVAAALFVGLGLAATPSLVSAYARDRCSGEEYAAAFSAISAALGVGQLIGPVAAGALADHFGTAAAPLFAAAAYGIAAACAVMDAQRVRTD
jgi:MFS family permease